MTSMPRVRYVLSFGALKKLIYDDEHFENAILQILGYKQIPGSNNSFRLLLNDGIVLFPHAILATQLNNLIYNKCLEKYTIFRLKDYAYSDSIANKKLIMCLDIEVLVPGSEINEKITEKDIIIEDNSSVAKLSTPIQVLSEPNYPSSTSELCFHDATENSSSASRSQVLFDSEPHPSTSDVAQNWDTAPSNVNNFSFLNAKGNALFSSICSLSPYLNKWTIRARVSYKSPIVHYSNSQRQGDYFSFHLLDESGEIRAVAFNEHAERFHEFLEVFKIYIISNADVKPAPDIRSVNNDFEITIGNRTKIEQCTTDESSIPMPVFNFRTIRQITLLPEDTWIDVIGICDQVSDVDIVISKSYNKEIFKRNISLIDESKSSITVTLWGAIAESFPEAGNHVVAIKNGKVTYFRGLTLNVTSMSMIYIDPCIDNAFKLRSWFQSLDSSVSQSLSFSFNSSQQTASENWKTLTEVFAYDKINIPLYHNTKATIVMVRKEKCMYKACTSLGCLKKLNELDNGLYNCSKCNINSNIFNWVLLLTFQVADFTGSHWITAFKETAESLIGVSSDVLNQIKNEDEDKFYEILGKLNLKSFIFKMRSNYEVYNDDTRLKSIVLSFSSDDPISYTKKLLIDIKRMSRILNNS